MDSVKNSILLNFEQNWWFEFKVMTKNVHVPETCIVEIRTLDEHFYIDHGILLSEWTSLIELILGKESQERSIIKLIQFLFSEKFRLQAMYPKSQPSEYCCSGSIEHSRGGKSILSSHIGQKWAYVQAKS